MENGRRRILQFAAAIIGTVLVSLLGAWFTFGQQQSEQLVRLEAQEDEALRQQQIDRATAQALNETIRVMQGRLAELETRIAVNEATIETLASVTAVSGLVVRWRIRLALWILPGFGRPEHCLFLGEHAHVKGVCRRCGLQEPLYW